MPLESVWSFYPKFAAESVWKLAQWISLFTRLRLIRRKVIRDPRKREYLDLALQPVSDDEPQTREVFHHVAEAAAAKIS